MIDIRTIEFFDKNDKHLFKKYRSISQDYLQLIEALRENPYLGTDLGNNVRKIRISISGKGKGCLVHLTRHPFVSHTSRRLFCKHQTYFQFFHFRNNSFIDITKYGLNHFKLRLHFFRKHHSYQRQHLISKSSKTYNFICNQ